MLPGKEYQVMTENDASTNDSIGGTAAPQPPRDQPARQRKIAPGDLVLGGLLLTSDVVRSWIDEQAPAESEVMAAQADGRPVLLSQAQWEETFALAEGNRTRSAAIGLAVTTQSRLSRAGKALTLAGDAAAGFAIKPLRRSRLLQPVRNGFNHLVEIGDSQVNRWAAIGREQEVRSRVMTRATLNQLVDDSVELLSDEPHVQVIVQEVVAGQGLGITEELLDEVRRRAVFLDLRGEKFVGKILHRAPRDTLPGPGFAISVAPNLRDQARHPGKPNLAGQYAGFASRIMAFVIDLLVLIVGLATVGMLITAGREIFHIGSILQRIYGFTPNEDRVLAGVATSILIGAYWVVSWWMTGRSIGKIIMGIRIVGPGGEYPTFWRSVRRYLGYLVIVLSLGIGFLWVLIDNRRQGWDDKIAGTFVVYAWPARPQETFLIDQARKSDDASQRVT